MYYLGIKCKCNGNPCDFNYLDFYFNNIQEKFNFAKHILDVFNYEIVMKFLENE